jgi:alanine-glyoxylate transaminase/serine-glyoxylate transaminase/serine-pyruvate transaminase
VRVPDGVDDARVRARLLREYNIEISGGLGPLKGKIWRIGLMGHSSQPRLVLGLLAALEVILASEGHRVPAGTATAQAAGAM